MTVLLSVVLGVVIGLSLGALGGGGSILTVPALVYAVGESAHAATTESLVIVGITSIAAAVGHARARHVRWGPGTLFGLVGVISSYAGTALNRHVNPNALLLAFAALIVIAALAMLHRTRSPSRPPVRRQAVVALPGSRPATANNDTPATGPVATAFWPAPAAIGKDAADDPPGHPRTGPATQWAAAVKIVGAGLLVGFLTGFFGVGGGFVIVPALVMVLGYEMPYAVGTSLLIIAITSAASLAARAGSETFHWAVIIPFTAAAIAGSLAGKQVADKVPNATLTRAFVALLLAVAGYVAIRSGTALTH